MKIMRTLNIYKYPIVTLLVGGLYYLFLVYSHDITFGDFQTFVQHPFQLSYGFDRWSDWSSRLFIEGSANAFSKSLILWKLITVITGAILFWSTGRILGNRRLWQTALLFCILILSNWNMLSTAGIFATTINYLWPASCLVFVIAILYKPFHNSRLNLISKIMIFPLFIFAMCSEQLAVFALILAVFYIAEKLYKKERISATLWILGGLSLAGVIDVFVSPGNAARQIIEVNYWWPGFDHLPLKKKIIDGALAMYSRLILAPEILAVVLIYALLFLSYIKQNLKAFITILPAAVVTVLFFFPATVGTPGTSIRQGNYFNELREMAIDFAPTYLPSAAQERIYLAIFILITLCIGGAILYLYGRSRKSYTTLFFLGAGIAISMAVSLSPTLFASNTRTIYYLVTIITVIDFVVIQDIIREKFSTSKNKRDKSLHPLTADQKR